MEEAFYEPVRWGRNKSKNGRTSGGRNKGYRGHDRRGGNKDCSKEDEIEKGSGNRWNSDGGLETCKRGIMDKIGGPAKGTIWKKGTIPKDWRKSIIIPLYKRGDKEKIGNYRGISLLCTAYKIYAEVLRNRLEKEAEEKNKVPESQAGFRKGRSTIDNIMILHHIMQREKRKGRKNGKVYMINTNQKTLIYSSTNKFLQ